MKRLKTGTFKTMVACAALLVGLLSIYGFAQNITLAKPTAAVRAADVVAAYKSSFVPISTTPDGPPSEIVTTKVYDPDGVEIGYIKETQQLVTADGHLMRTADDSQSTHYDEVDKQLVDSANKKMKIYYDTYMLKHTIQSSSGKELLTIKLTDEIFMTTIKDPNDGLVKTIYTTRKLIKPNLGTRLNPFKKSEYKEEFYDINGRFIPNSWFVNHEHAAWYKKALSYTPMSYLVGLFKTYKPTTWVQVKSVGTYAALYQELFMSTEHPWDKLEGFVTEDGLDIYIDPRNGQLSYKLFGPIYNYKTGLPMIIKANDQGQSQIITIPDGKVQTVENGCLVNALTIDYMYKHGIEFYVHYIDTEEYGTLNALALWDAKTKQWKLPNGDSAKGIVRDGVVVGGKQPKISTPIDLIKSAWNAAKNVVSNVANLGKGTAETVKAIFSIIVIAVVVAIPVGIILKARKSARNGGSK